MQKWVTSVFHRGTEGSSQKPPFCHPLFSLRFQKHASYQRAENSYKLKITTLAHFVRKANQVTVGTPALSPQFSLKVFCQWKKPRHLQIFHSSSVQQTHAIFPNTAWSWKRSVFEQEEHTQTCRKVVRHRTTRFLKHFTILLIILLFSKYATLIVRVIHS